MSERMKRWYVTDDGITTQHETKQAAKEYAESRLDEYRRQFREDGVWPSAVGRLAWGRVEAASMKMWDGFELVEVR